MEGAFANEMLLIILDVGSFRASDSDDMGQCDESLVSHTMGPISVSISISISIRRARCCSAFRMSSITGNTASYHMEAALLGWVDGCIVPV
jgi:hypothetical protein